jgi:hypothetical protein
MPQLHGICKLMTYKHGLLKSENCPPLKTACLIRWFILVNHFRALTTPTLLESYMFLWSL